MTSLPPDPHDRPALLVDVRPERDGALVVAADGEIDLETSPALARAIQSGLDGNHRLVIDLRSVTFIDSTGIALLLEKYDQAQRLGVEICIEPSAIVRRVLAIAGVDRVLPLPAL
jgi:anti-sigma B factor antagonist